jgi:hypothetical protein
MTAVALESCAESRTAAGAHTHPAAQISAKLANPMGEFKRNGFEERRQYK